MASIEELTQDDIDKMEAALERYKVENQKFRTQRDEYKAQADAGELNEKFRTRALAAEAKLKLAALGVKDTDRLVKYVDFSKVAIDDEDNITGLDEQIEGLKSDFSEVFDPKKRVGGKADAAANTPASTPKTTTELQIAALFGK
jgi:hypothetical protein